MLTQLANGKLINPPRPRLCTVDICTIVANCNDIAFQIWSTVAGYEEQLAEGNLAYQKRRNLLNKLQLFTRWRGSIIFE